MEDKESQGHQSESTSNDIESGISQKFEEKYEHAEFWAESGRDEHLESKREYLTKNDICSENEFDLLMVRCLTRKIAGLLGTAEIMERQIKLIEKELDKPLSSTDNISCQACQELYQQAEEANDRRNEILINMGKRDGELFRQLSKKTPEGDIPTEIETKTEQD